MSFIWTAISDTGVWTIFLETILLIISLMFVLLGALTAYFGSGKSRVAGISLLGVGVLIPILLWLFIWRTNVGHFMNDLLLPGLIYVGGALIGVIVGFVVFLGIIMKT